MIFIPILISSGVLLSVLRSRKPVWKVIKPPTGTGPIYTPPVYTPPVATPPPVVASPPIVPTTNLDALSSYNLDRVNAYRAQGGVAPLRYDTALSAFALEGSRQLASDHSPHAHFRTRARRNPLFGNAYAENQGDESGVYRMDADPMRNAQKQIDATLQMMMDEGPPPAGRTNHYSNIMASKFQRIGIGLLDVNGRLYLTNDFSS